MEGDRKREWEKEESSTLSTSHFSRLRALRAMIWLGNSQCARGEEKNRKQGSRHVFPAFQRAEKS